MAQRGAPNAERYREWWNSENKGSRTWVADAGALLGVRITTCRRMSLTKETDRLWEQLRPLYDRCMLTCSALRKNMGMRLCRLTDRFLRICWGTLEPGMGQRLFVDGIAKACTELRPDKIFAGAEDGCEGMGALRQAFFTFA